MSSVGQERQTDRREATKVESVQLSKQWTRKVVKGWRRTLKKGKPSEMAKMDEKPKVKLSGKEIEKEELPGVEPSTEVEGDLEIARDIAGDEKNDLVIEKKTKLNFSETEVR